MKKSKIVVITGSNNGIGFAFAEHLLELGHVVVLNFRKRKFDTNKLLKNYPNRCFIFKTDVTKEQEVKKMVSYISKKFKNIDLLINNVGDYIYKDLLNLTQKEFTDIIDSNLISAFLCTKLFLPLLRRNSQIINLGYASCDRITYSRYRMPYTLSKNGVFILTKILANILSSKGIKVNMISPGVVENSIRKPGNLPLGRAMQFEDLFSALDYLIGSKSQYVSGCNIEISCSYFPQNSY